MDPNVLIGAIVTGVFGVIVELIRRRAPRVASSRGPVRRPHRPGSPAAVRPDDGVATHAARDAALADFVRTSKTPWARMLLVLVPLSLIAPVVEAFVGFVNLIAVLPIATAVLAYRRPVPWHWAAMSVAGLHAITYLSLWFGSAAFTTQDLVLALAIYLVNFALVAVIAHARLEAVATRLDPRGLAPP